MLRVHLADGRTLRFDLADVDQESAWLRLAGDLKFQELITGLTLQCNGVQHSLSRPSGYRRVWMFAEFLPPNPQLKFKGGQRMVCQFDDNRTVVMVHSEQRASRISMTKSGTMVYIPVERRPGSGNASGSPDKPKHPDQRGAVRYSAPRRD